MNKEIEQDGFITRDMDLMKSEQRFPRSMVLIKDMQIPYSCDRCRLQDRHHKECSIKWKKVAAYNIENEMHRPKWCPLTEVVPYGPEGTFYKEK